jgi:putative phosphoesterase
MKRIGVISDTHGLVDSKLMPFFMDCERLLHAGDVGQKSTLASLNEIAPTDAVRGNTDTLTLPNSLLLEIGSLRIFVVHILALAGEEIARLKPDVVIYGHSHRMDVSFRSDEERPLLYFNPGSAGPRRQNLRRTAGLFELSEKNLTVKTIDLDTGIVTEHGQFAFT